jgi:hypothetical protein
MYLPMSLSFILLVQLLCGSHLYLPITSTPRSSVVYQAMMIMPDVNHLKAGTCACIFPSLSQGE